MINCELKYMEKCPSYPNCSAPVCPLDPLQDRRISRSGEEKCRAKTMTRFTIAKDSQLKYWGLKKCELRDALDGIKKYRKIYSYLKSKGRLPKARDRLKD